MYQVLQSDTDNLSDLYKHFVSAKHDVTKACLKQVKRKKKKESCNNPRVHAARQRMPEANHAYNRERDSQLLWDKYKLEKHELYSSSATIEREELEQKGSRTYMKPSSMQEVGS